MRTLIFSVTTGILLSISSTFAGDGVGNGGDGNAAEFILTAKTAMELMKKISPSNLQGINIDAFSGAILNTEVHSKDQLILDGHEVDAINYPKKKLIEVSRSRWSTLRGETETISRFNLVLHEYLFIMGLNDSQYRISQKLISAISPSSFSTEKWWNPMNPTNFLGVGMFTPSSTCSFGSESFDFDLSKATETKISEVDCEGIHRKIIAEKTQNLGASTDGLKGTFHSFKITVYDEKGQLIGNLDSYVPEWGRCLVPTSDYCSQSGEIHIGNMFFTFGLFTH